MRRKYSRNFILLLLGGFFLLLSGSAVLAVEQPDVLNAIQQARKAGVSEEQLNHLLGLGYKYGLKEREVVQLVNVIRDAEAHNLPVAPFVSKVEEGLTKRARISLIEQVTRREMEQYDFVRELAHRTLNTWGVPRKDLKDQELVRATRVLLMGVSRSELKEVLENAPRVSRGELVNSVEFLAALKQAVAIFAEIGQQAEDWEPEIWKLVEW